MWVLWEGLDEGYRRREQADQKWTVIKRQDETSVVLRLLERPGGLAHVTLELIPASTLPLFVLGGLPGSRVVLLPPREREGSVSKMKQRRSMSDCLYEIIAKDQR